MPPVNTIIVQTVLLPPERQNKEALEQAQRLLKKALQPIDEALDGKDYLIGEFSGADIILGLAVFMSNRLGCVSEEMQNIKGYVERIQARPAFQTAITMQ